MEDEPTQVTPKGAEIPVPTRSQVLRDFQKATEPVKKQPKRSRRRKRRPSK